MSQIISTDVPNDLKDRIEDEQEDGESRSAAVRRLIRAGLDSKKETGDSVPLPLYIAWLGSILAAAGLLESTASMGMGGVGLFIGGLGYYIYQQRNP